MSGKWFETEPGFCPECGTILPMLRAVGGVQCYSCKRQYGPEVFGDMECHYVIHFSNRKEKSAKQKKGRRDEGDNTEGPVVDRQCRMCGNDKMSYATLQLRSADEGQTVFYTCTKCKFKETENS